MEKFIKIQQELKAPKNQYSKFGDYWYRSCEDILEAVKPLLNGAILTIQDEVVLIGDRYYIKATATFIDGEFKISTSAFAREPLNKTKMDEPQITGTASSYARKYALNGLFLIDDTKDADTDEYKKQTKTDETPEQKYVKLLNEKKIYSDELRIAFNKMSLEEKRQEFKRVEKL